MLLAVVLFLIIIAALFFFSNKSAPTPAPQNAPQVTTAETPRATLHKSDDLIPAAENPPATQAEQPQETEISSEARENVTLEELTIKKARSSPEFLRQDSVEDVQIRSSNSIIEDFTETLPTQQSEVDQKTIEAKKTVVKGFNFRNKKSSSQSVTESIVSSNTNKTVEFTPKNQLSGSSQNIEEQTVATFETTLVKEPSTSLSNSTGDVNNATKPPLKGKGFNFRNPGGKKLTGNSATTQSAGAGSQPASQNGSPVKSNSLTESTANKENNCMIQATTQPKESETQDKKVRGFNFRNASKVKVE